jgi:hypothetical protein
MAGLASGVHVFAATLEKPAVEVDLQPDKFAHIWTAPEQPSYTVTLRNTTYTTSANVSLNAAALALRDLINGVSGFLNTSATTSLAR